MPTMSREYVLASLVKRFPEDADLVVEFVQESDGEDGDGYWHGVTGDALSEAFRAYVASVSRPREAS